MFRGVPGAMVMVFYTIVICCVMERLAVIERFSLKARVPGILMNLAQIAFSVGLIWPLAELWELLGLGGYIIIPLWRWLEPLGWGGYALQWLVAVLVSDFCAYWRHRAEHKWFWPIHAVHHAPTDLHAANDIGHPAQVWTNPLFVSMPLSMIQFDGPATPAAILFIVSLLSFYIHSPIDVHFGPFRKVLVDNRFHRIHHSLEERHFDKNFGICFSIWDRLFGTAYDPAPSEWPSVGVAGVVAPRTLQAYLLFPWRVYRDRKTGCEYAVEAAEPCLTCARSLPAN